MNPKEINEEIKKYFVKGDSKDHKCLLCNGEINGTVSNQRDHIAAKHSENATRLNITKRSRKRQRVPAGQDDCQQRDDTTQSAVPETKVVKVQVNPNEDIREIIEFFLKHNLSIQAADAFGKISIIKQSLNPLNVSINRDNLRRYVMNASKNIYSLIADEVKDVLISLMFDSASRYNRHVFGVNIRFMKDGKIKERNIGVLTQHGHQFGTILASEIHNLLDKINKKVDDVYVSCTDNGKNMLKTSQLIIEAQKEINIFSLISDEDVIIDHESIASEVRLIQLNENNGDNSSEGIVCEEADRFETLNLWENEIGNLGSLACCGAHNLSLASKKVTTSLDDKFIPLRNFIKQFHHVSHAQLLAGLPRPLSENTTRWSSTYNMVKNFYDHKDQYSSIPHPAFNLKPITWEFVEEYESIFKHVNDAILYFQGAQHTMSECYIQWKRMESAIALKPQGKFGMKSKILHQLELQSKKYLECDAMIANLIYDPRIEWKLDGPIFNYDLFKRGLDNILRVFVATNNMDEELNDLALSPEDELLRTILGHVPNSQRSIDSLKAAVTEFAFRTSRIPLNQDMNLFSFWHQLRNSDKFSFMPQVSKTILSAPFTQVSVERSFSVFALVLTHLRTRLSDDLLNAILVTRSNSDLLVNMKFP